MAFTLSSTYFRTAKNGLYKRRFASTMHLITMSPIQPPGQATRLHRKVSQYQGVSTAAQNPGRPLGLVALGKLFANPPTMRRNRPVSPAPNARKSRK